MSEIFPDRAEWLAAFAEIASRRAPVPEAPSGPPITTPKLAQPHVKPLRGDRGITPNPKETPEKSETETIAVRGVALDPVEARVGRLRNLNEHLLNRFGEFFRSITVGSPKWVRRMEREVRAGNKQTIKLLEGYRHVLPQSLLEAVLAVRVVAAPQVRKDAAVVFQTRTTVNP